MLMRHVCGYKPQELKKYMIEREILLNQIMLGECQNLFKIFQNQKHIADKIVETFRNRKIINIMVVAKTQSGKTGSICATIQSYLNDPNNIIPIANIYIITGLSSVDWKDQTIGRLPDCIRDRICHRPSLERLFIDEIKNKKNVLVIIDEVQIAATKDQTLYKAFKGAGFLNKSTLYQNDVKIIEFSATPDGTLYDLQNWKDAACKLMSRPGAGYTGAIDLHAAHRLKQYKNLDPSNNNNIKALANIKDLKDVIDKYVDPLYHIIRTKPKPKQSLTISAFAKVFKKQNYIFIKHDETTKIKDINDILNIKPKKHTLIFIKEMMRCAKTICKKYMGVLYDRYTITLNDTAVIQGLVGRNTGYDVNNVSICYTNIDSVVKYEQLWESNFDNKNVKWKSNSTCYKDGKLSGKITFNTLEDSAKQNTSTSTPGPVIKEFNTYDEVKKYFNDHLKKVLHYKGRGPNKVKIYEDGFYRARLRSRPEIYSYAEIIINQRHGLTKHNYGYNL